MRDDKVHWFSKEEARKYVFVGKQRDDLIFISHAGKYAFSSKVSYNLCGPFNSEEECRKALVDIFAYISAKERG